MLRSNKFLSVISRVQQIHPSIICGTGWFLLSSIVLRTVGRRGDILIVVSAIITQWSSLVGGNGFIHVIGLLAQAFFSARIIFQWILSKKAKKVVSPSIFWILSIAGSYLLCIYGWLRDDFSIIFGQSISYYTYLWGLNEKGIWNKLHGVLKTLLVITPIIATAFMLHDVQHFIDGFFRNEKVPLWLLVFGSMGQVIFTLRFVYQWAYSFHHKESLLPAGFWITSLVGSSVIAAYGVFRLDPVLILDQSVGSIAYLRNLMIRRKSSK